jgi:hypothetical protein
MLRRKIYRECCCYILIFPLLIPPEKWVYTTFFPRKDQYILIFPPWFWGGNLSIYWSFPLMLNSPLCIDRLYKGNKSYKGSLYDFDPMETFVEHLMLKKEDHLYFFLSVILFEILANDCSLTPMFYFEPCRPCFFIDGYIIHKLYYPRLD